MAPRQQRKAQTPVDTTYGHLQPQAPDIERVVLGALMVDKDAFTMVSDVLKPETFYEPRHKMIFEAIQALSVDERPVDIMTVTEQLRRDGNLETVGGPAYVVDLSSHVISSANIVYHSKILAQKSLARQLISFASVVQTDAFDETADVDETMQRAEAMLFELSQKNMKQDYTHIAPVVDRAIDILQKASTNTDGLTGVPTGYSRLDHYTSGWQKSDLIIIAGRPAMGKTSFALSLAKNMAVDYQKPVAFFSLEMDNVQLVNRLLSNVCEIEGRKLLNGQLDDSEWKRLDTNLRRLASAPIYVDDTPGMSIFELRSKARRLHKEKKIECIMIDYLQLMNANGARFNSRQEEVSTISRSLKGLAKELKIPVIALSQLNRGVEGRGAGAENANVDTHRPQLSDLRESGAIEQDADMVLFVHRPEYYHILRDANGRDLRGMAQIIIAKHRKGATADVTVRFRGEFTRFEDPVENTGGSSASLEGEFISSKMTPEAPDVVNLSPADDYASLPEGMIPPEGMAPGGLPPY